MIPFDGAFAAQSPQAFIDARARRAARRRARVASARTSASATARAATPRCCARRRRSRRASSAWSRLDGEVVSSSHIRGLVAAGDVAAADAASSAPRSQMRGPVVHGDKRGRTLGFPTANLVPDPALVVPAHGVYACRAAVEADGTWTPWPAAVNVGVRPTFVTGRGVLVEAFLLGFEGDLYGRELRLAFLERLRGERALRLRRRPGRPDGAATSRTRVASTA